MIIKLDGKSYLLDLKKIFDFVNYSNAHPVKESEIVDTYQNDDENGTASNDEAFTVNSKMIRETTSYGAAQIDALRYDLLRSIIQQVLEFGYDEHEDIAHPPFGFGVAFNTLIKEGFLKEI